MSTTTETVTFDDFSGGEFGSKGAHKADPNQWTGSNVIVHQDGTIGPRPGLRKHDVTGNVGGDVWAIKFIGLPGKMLAIVIDDKVYSTDVDTNAFTLTEEVTLDDTPTEHVQIEFYDPNGDLYLVNPTFNAYAIDWAGGTKTAFTVASTTRGPRGVKLYRDRLFVFDDATTGEPTYRVYFSDPADLTNFPDVNQFDIGYFWDLYAAIDLANHLYFAQRQAGWWVLIGGSPATLTLRQLRTDPPAFAESSGASQSAYVSENGQVWYFRPGNYLAVSNGAAFDEKSWSHLNLGAVSPNRWGLYFDNFGQDVLYKDDLSDRALWRHWGTWAFADFTVDLDGQFCTTEFKNRAIFVGAADVEDDNQHAYYSLDLTATRPGFLDDDNARPGDDSDTPLAANFSTPQWRHKAGRTFKVRQVIVDFVKYDWGSNVDDTIVNNITCRAFVFARSNTVGGVNDGFFTEGPQTWTEAASFAETGGSEDRARFNFGQDIGSAFQLDFAELVGVNIKKITVILDLQERYER